MTVGKENSARAKPAHRRSLLVVHGTLAEPVRDKQDDIPRLGRLGQQQQKQSGED